MGVRIRRRMAQHQLLRKYCDTGDRSALEEYFNNEIISEETKSNILLEACKHGHLDVIELLHNNEINPTDKDGLTLLHHAAKYGYLDILIYLSANLDNKNPGQISKDEYSGKTPLHYAAEEGHLHIVVYYLDILDNKNPQDNNLETPLHLAASNGHYDLVNYMIFVQNLVNIGRDQLPCTMLLIMDMLKLYNYFVKI